jgi:8-oxo-dGTP pyrophosphatase MutT (NUDIX family)
LNSIVTLIEQYQQHVLPLWKDIPGYNETKEKDVLRRFIEFSQNTSDIFDAKNPVGHLTGSAMVVDEAFSQVVLTLHAKLQKWLQLGGHADNHPLLHEVALREAEEESGLKDLALYRFSDLPLPFDFCIHEIPERKGFPSHLHYDVRYIIIAKDKELIRSEESIDLGWFSFADAFRMCPEESMQRQLVKSSRVRSLPSSSLP